MSKLRIGFVGAGGMGQMAHLSNYAVLKDLCDVVALAEVRPEQAKLVAARYGIPEVYSDHLELMKHAKVDAIVASQPFRRHSIIIPDIIKAGIPVFTEKPLCLSVEEGQKLVDLGEKYNALHMVGYHKRSDPAMEYGQSVIQEWLASKEYGRMKYVRVTMPSGDYINGTDAPLNANDTIDTVFEQEADPQGFSKESAQKYEFFVNFYIHQINAIRFLLNEPYKLTYADPSGVLLVGHSDSGVCAALEMTPYSNTIDWQESILVGFDYGFVKIELPPPLARQRAGKVYVQRDIPGGVPTITEVQMPNRSAMRNQAMNFIAAVKGERPPAATAKDALEDLKIAKDYILSLYK